ncbi:hypothetical protein [Paenibacillus sp. FSL H7-0326]|uniref:hypothetical protein n=1 Tax=Paenibacillus sp. FSL H7-0326 TaxID=1921144 RepID=UPI0015C2C71B|nr:hypothetical protein [Paenibacillus sp. FSL H7-0326]
MQLEQSNRHYTGKVAPPIEYVGASTLADLFGTTQQNITKTAKAMLNPTYRGKEKRFPRPDALFDGRPLWKKERFEEE